MPVRSLVHLLEPPPPVVEPSPTPAPPPPEREYFEWTPAGGPSLILSDHVLSGIMLGGVDDDRRAVIGLDMPPQEEFDTELPRGGQLANGRRWLARPVALPIVIHADSLDELQTHRRQLMDAFNPARGEGVLTVAYPGGQRRHLNATYSSGLDVAEIGRAGYPYSDSFTVALKARDPLPYGDEEFIIFDPPEDYEFYAPAGDDVNVYYISSSATTGDVTVFIDSKELVFPEWRLEGPIATATLRNRETGQTLELTPNLQAGESLTIRTDPATVPQRKFTRETGVSVWASVAGQFPVMWGLQPGENRVTVLLTATVPGQSSARLTYRPRYLTA